MYVAASECPSESDVPCSSVNNAFAAAFNRAQQHGWSPGANGNDRDTCRRPMVQVIIKQSVPVMTICRRMFFGRRRRVCRRLLLQAGLRHCLCFVSVANRISCVVNRPTRGWSPKISRRRHRSRRPPRAHRTGRTHQAAGVAVPCNTRGR